MLFLLSFSLFNPKFIAEYDIKGNSNVGYIECTAEIHKGGNFSQFTATIWSDLAINDDQYTDLDESILYIVYFNKTSSNIKGEIHNKKFTSSFTSDIITINASASEIIVPIDSITTAKITFTNDYQKFTLATEKVGSGTIANIYGMRHFQFKKSLAQMNFYTVFFFAIAIMAIQLYTFWRQAKQPSYQNEDDKRMQAEVNAAITSHIRKIEEEEEASEQIEERKETEGVQHRGNKQSK